MSLLSFAVGDARVDLPVGAVREVTRLPRVTRLPGASPGTLGVFNHHGAAIAVLSARTLLGLPARADSADAIVVVVDHGPRQIGLVVDAALDQAAEDGVASDVARLLSGALGREGRP